MTDVDGLGLAEPIQGFIRLKSDRPPRITAALVTQHVLPTGKPRITYGVADDYGIAQLHFNVQILHADGTTQDQLIDRPIDDGPQKVLQGRYPLDLASMNLVKGDQLKISLEACDFRGKRPGHWAAGEPLVLHVTDERGVLAAMSETDQRSARQLESIIHANWESETDHAIFHHLYVHDRIRGGYPRPGRRPGSRFRHAPPQAGNSAASPRRRAELVSSILDIQLEQLEENGLDQLPLYRDIKQMRHQPRRFDRGGNGRSRRSVLRAQEEEPEKRDATFILARQKIRDVVVRLSIERQNLLRRLKTAEMAAQVKRLISMETVTHDGTVSLADLTKGRQESTLLSTIQDQRDIKALFLRLIETLNDVRGWGGDVGQGAA